MVVLLANTAPVAFGAIAIPIITAGNLTGIDYHQIGAYVGRQTPVLAVFVPLLLVLLVDGKRGLKQTWPVALVIGCAFAVAQWLSANYISVELTDIIASLVAPGRRACLPALLEAQGRARPRWSASRAELRQRRTWQPIGDCPITAPSRPRSPVAASSWRCSRTCWSSSCSRWRSCSAPSRTFLAGTDLKIELARPRRPAAHRSAAGQPPRPSTPSSGCPAPAPCC